MTVVILDFQFKILLFFIYKSPSYFLPSFESTGLLVQDKKFKIDFQDGCHLGFSMKDFSYLVESHLCNSPVTFN